MPLPRRTGAGILSLRHFLFLEGTEFPLEAKLGGPSKALSRSLAERSKLTACAGALFAVVAWSREASEPQYRDSMKCDAWEVVVPELVFELEGE